MIAILENEKDMKQWHLPLQERTRSRLVISVSRPHRRIKSHLSKIFRIVNYFRFKYRVNSAYAESRSWCSCLASSSSICSIALMAFNFNSHLWTNLFASKSLGVSGRRVKLSIRSDRSGWSSSTARWSSLTASIVVIKCWTVSATVTATPPAFSSDPLIGSGIPIFSNRFTALGQSMLYNCKNALRLTMKTETKLLIKGAKHGLQIWKTYSVVKPPSAAFSAKRNWEINLLHSVVYFVYVIPLEDDIWKSHQHISRLFMDTYLLTRNIILCICPFQMLSRHNDGVQICLLIILLSLARCAVKFNLRITVGEHSRHLCFLHSMRVRCSGSVSHVRKLCVKVEYLLFHWTMAIFDLQYCIRTLRNEQVNFIQSCTVSSWHVWISFFSKSTLTVFKSFCHKLQCNDIFT